MKTVRKLIFLRPCGRADAVHRSSRRSFHGCRTLLRRLKSTLLSKGAWQQLTRIEDLCHTCLLQVALPRRRMCGEVSSRRTTTSPTSKNGLATRCGQALVKCRICGSFLDPQLEHEETCSTAEATRGHHACVHAVVVGM